MIASTAEQLCFSGGHNPPTWANGFLFPACASAKGKFTVMIEQPQLLAKERNVPNGCKKLRRCYTELVQSAAKQRSKYFAAVYSRFKQPFA
jgi:ubiquitin